MNYIVEQGRITAYNPKLSLFKVQLDDQISAAENGVDAYLLSATPYDDGGGIMSAPKAAKLIGAQCLIAHYDRIYHIIGFLQPRHAIQKGPLPAMPVDNGELWITHNTPSAIGFSQDGTIGLNADRWATLAVNPLGKITSYFKNMIMNFKHGSISMLFDSETKEGKFIMWVRKTLDLSVLPDYKSEKPADSFAMQIGSQATDDHIVDIEIKQDYDSSKKPQFKSRFKLGKQQSGIYCEQLTTNETDNIKHSYIANLDGSVSFKVINADEVKCEIKIDGEGNVTIKTADAAKIKLGGTDNEQPLVTKAWVEKIFAQHMHPTAAQGPPSAPIPMVIPPTTGDAKTNYFTHTTLGE